MYSDSKTEQSEYSPRNYEQSSKENMGIVETNHRLDDNGLVWDRLNSSTRVNPKSDL